jgi:hypothetical protein
MLHTTKQWKHFAAMLAIGDGVMALIQPSMDAEAWAAGPEWWNQSMRFFKRHPQLTRVIAAAQIAGGIWWALSNEPRRSARDEWSGEDESELESTQVA